MFLVLVSCQSSYQVNNQNQDKGNISHLIKKLENASGKEIMVIAHRGDWRNAPENSVQSIKNCILKKIDMVEIDIRETKDGQLVLMHDETIDRTTTGKGYLKDWTLEDLKKLKLVDESGKVTNETVPTLEEALLASKNQILVNLDKSYGIFQKCYPILIKTGTIHQVVIKGTSTRQEVERDFGKYLDEVYFMPILILPNPKASEIVADYMKHRKPVAFEFVVPSDTIALIKQFKDIRKQGSSVWVNSLWSDHCAGHDDEKAVNNPQLYNWFVDNGINMIQTDRPELLLNYLRRNGLHR